jgi:hypothetical protein
VRLSLGSWKICSVVPDSTSTPVRVSVSESVSTWKNAVRPLTRLACCMLCVTTTIVICDLSSRIKSSMAPVAIGSSAEAGSSISTTSGSTAIARAMHSRCACPPDRLRPDVRRRFLTSSHRAALRSERSTISSSLLLWRSPLTRGPKATLS